MIARPLLFAASVLALTSVANAGDLSVSANDWTGVYVGFGLGGGFGDADLSASGGGSSRLDESLQASSSSIFTGDILCLTTCSGEANSRASASGDAGEFGLLGRGEIGADYQLERIVMGLNASYTLSDRSMSVSGSGGGDAEFTEVGIFVGEGSGQVKSDLNLGNSWAVGGRIGYLLSDSTLLFGTAGYTQMKAKLKSRFNGSAAAGDGQIEPSGISADYDISSSRTEWMDGYYLGAGVETLLFENFSLKFEYRFADYGKIRTSAEASDGSVEACQTNCWNANVESEADITDHSLMATVSFRL